MWTLRSLAKLATRSWDSRLPEHVPSKKKSVNTSGSGHVSSLGCTLHCLSREVHHSHPVSITEVPLHHHNCHIICPSFYRKHKWIFLSRGEEDWKRRGTQHMFQLKMCWEDVPKCVWSMRRPCWEVVSPWYKYITHIQVRNISRLNNILNQPDCSN